jgi:hypothetical protein
VLTWDPSVTDSMSTLGSYNRCYNFSYFTFIVETCSLIFTQSIYVAFDCIFQYIIYSNQHNRIESITFVLELI